MKHLSRPVEGFLVILVKRSKGSKTPAIVVQM